MNKFLLKYRPVFAPEGAAGGGDPAAAAAAAAGAKPWHDGVEAEILGHWQNKGWKVDDPKEVALAATRQAREAEKHFGVPADQLLKMPKADAKPEEIKAFWNRLGAPAEAKDYDFTNVKGADGQPIAAPLAEAIRAAAAEAYLPKDAAAKVAASVLKHLDDTRAADALVSNAKLGEEKANLAKNWGTKYDFNHLQAMEGAKRLGITPEAVKALEGQIGYASVMESMRKIGAATSEDTFIERGASGSGTVTTREGAVSRKAELMADPGWADRYLKGGATEKQEMSALNTMIDGAARAA
jgi:hypothetical protein